jgi:hypothetical protein
LSLKIKQEQEMRIRRFIGELCIFKHRASASKNELKAAEHIYQIMRNIGLVAKIDYFRSQQRMTWELIAIMLFFIAEVVLYFYYPVLSLISGLVGVILFWGYFTTAFKPLAPLFRFARSCNVVGRIMHSNAPFKVIFTAHHDTARSGPLWNPKTVANFRLNFLIGFFVIIALQLLLILRVTSSNFLVIKFLVLLIGVYIIGHIVVLLISGLKGELVQGASDNASGVAVMLDIASRLKEDSFPLIDFWFVSTGSEEVGAVGMSSFLKTYSDDLTKDHTYFINFDNLGKGTPHYFLGEGMLNFYKFSRDLINAAKKTAQIKEFKTISPAKYKVAYTDAIVPACRGHQAILFLALDERGLIPNWHWPTDTIENIDFEVPQLTSDFVMEMLTNLSEILKRKLEKNAEELKKLQKEMLESEAF